MNDSISHHPSICAVILTKDEEKNLPRCIASLKWCSKIIILDSGSTDRTCEVASSLKVQVVTHIPSQPFLISEQRNWILDHDDLQTEWVLFLDADEEIPADLASEIQRLCSQTDSAYNAYELTPRYLFWDRWLKRTQGYPNWHPRLLKRGEVKFCGGVWEHFDKNARVGRILIPYNHYANSKGIADWIIRHNRYSSWDADIAFQYLQTGQETSLLTQRKKFLRKCAAQLWPFRPFARFIQMYFLRLGFIEGIPALVLCVMYAVYEFMVVVKIAELRRLHYHKNL
ncbi:MAG: glycosyltransferase family 2 protein [Verrucomicrobiota bacterium]